ncbi:tRNA 2-thiouridine(34) synthase MnmA [Candidatus Peregrinibacteria bacterium]|nr:tRNA 2-thiouridine(34) synthase MnmA [Candidatus Peregrinibacteria bacterium]
MKIAVLTSGGVDSSVALKLLQEQGHDVTAFYLKIWLEDELSFLGANCPWEEDLKYLRAICGKNKIPLEVISMQKEYFDTVVSYTISEVKAGRTPNPDVMCNNNIKFGLFLKKISKSFEKIATGHYAEVYKKFGIYYLKKTPDPIKDQTYFLSNLKQKQLARLTFPLGKLAKEQVRKLAKKYHLPNQDRKDSQGICFLGKFKYSDFIKHYLGTKIGDIIEFETGKKLGTHEGFYYYTIGQRKGIKLSGGPWFVIKKNIKKNIVYVSNHYHTADKKRDTFKIGKFNWFSGKITATKNLYVKLRHGENSYKCTIAKLSKNTAKIKISGNDQGIAPGQFAAFYSGKICLGSALILN